MARFINAGGQEICKDFEDGIVCLALFADNTAQFIIDRAGFGCCITRPANSMAEAISAFEGELGMNKDEFLKALQG